jgi:ribosomal protein S18 acetylase RimI-like enzyme
LNITLRSAIPADEDFLFNLFLSSREKDLLMIPEPQRTALMRMQYGGQKMTYTQQYPASENSIITVDGQDAGRIWIDRSDQAISVLDIAILPGYRNAGIGGSVYSGLIEESAASSKPLHAAVSTANPDSLRFHERQGFKRIENNGLHISLVRFVR